MSERSDNICVYDRSENDSVLLTGKKENDGNKSEREREKEGRLREDGWRELYRIIVRASR